MSLPLCAVCKVELVPSKKAKYCGERCRKRAQRNRGEVVELRPAPVEPEPAPRASTGVTAATTKALEEAGRLEHPAGAAALVLAARLDYGGDTGSAMAAMVRELRATMAEALEGVKVDTDGLDDLREARERRIARAGS